MATLASNALTLADWSARVDDGGKIAAIVEMLGNSCPLIQDALFLESNMPTGHKTTVRTGLPSATWRLLNYGVPKAKSTTAAIVDAIGNLEVYAEVDKDLADLNGNTAQFRLSEVRAFIEGMSQQVESTFFYGSTAVNPERFMGLSPRYNTVSTATAASAANVIDAGGSGSDNTSIWMVTWGENATHGIFPKGKISGLQHKDLGEHTLFDANGNMYQGYRDHFKWELGLTVRDWRYNTRVANIDVSELAGGSAANLLKAMVRAVHRMPTTGAGVGAVQSVGSPNGTQMSGVMGRTVIYCNRTVAAYLDMQALEKTNLALTYTEINGRPQTMFRGIPIHVSDAILNNEARVV